LESFEEMVFARFKESFYTAAKSEF